jgi:hypothetical protein
VAASSVPEEQPTVTDDNVTHLPEPGIVLDLDAEQRPSKDVKPPFTVKVGDRNVTFADPSEIDWRELATVSIPADLLRVALSKDDMKHLQSLALPTWKFSRLMEAYYDHYDMEDRIRAARQQAQFAGL